MNDQQPEQDGTPEFSFSETESWLKEQHQRIRLEVPAQLHGALTDRLNALDPQTLTELDKTAIETLIKQSLELKKLLIQFEHHLAQAAQSKATAETEIELFWEKFEISMLDPNAFQKKIKAYLDERYAKHAKETAFINETQKKALEVSKESEAEMKDYAPYYFTTAERERLYADRSAAEQKGPKALEKFKAKLVKLRQRKEKFTEDTLATILQNKHRPVFCQRQLERLEKICGAGIFDLPSVETVKAEIERPLELYNQAKKLKAEAEAVNIQFYQEFGHNLPGFRYHPAAANDNTPEAANDNEPELTEKMESKETQIQSLENLRIWVKEAMSFWAAHDPKLLDDPNFSIRGGRRAQNIMAANDNFPSHEEYLKMEASSGGQIARAKDDPGAKEWHYRTVDIPQYADDFTPAAAGNLNSKMSLYTQGDRRLFFLTCLLYIDYNKRGGAKAKSVSMNDYLAHIDHLLSQLRGQRAEDVKMAA